MVCEQLPNCHDCGAKPGEFHNPGCDVERCPKCGGQAIACGCIYEHCGIALATMDDTHPEIYENGPTDEMCDKWEREFYHAHRTPWTGIWPGAVECREYGFWAKMVPGRGWVRCDENDADATEDLNRLVCECRWDVGLQRFVPKK